AFRMLDGWAPRLAIGRARRRVGGPATGLAARALVDGLPQPRPAPASQRGFADTAKTETDEQRAAGFLVEAERGRERGIDDEARRRYGGYASGVVACRMLIMVVAAARDRRGGRCRRLHPCGVRLARQLFGHIDA